MSEFARPDGWHEQAIAELQADGWDVFVVWECETRDMALEQRLRDFLT